LGASCSGSAFSASVVSVSMLVRVLRGGKKLRVNSAFEGILTDVDVEAGLVDFSAVCEILLEKCLCVSLLPESRRPGPLLPLRFCSLYSFVLPVDSPSGRPSVHFVLPCTCRTER
jgi:hypothetical protein